MKKRWLLIISAFVYLVVVAALVLRHSVWQDEAQAWLIARDSGFFSIFSLAGYEGNGMLWHVLIYPLAHLGLPIMSMQILNAAFAVGAVYILFRYAPFPPVMRAAIAFGYFFIFEYSTIARNYSISAFLLFAVAALYPTRFARPLRFFVLLAILSLTNIHSLAIAIALAAMFVYEAWSRRPEISRKTVVQCGIFFALICLAQAILLLPPADLWHYTADTYVEMTYKHIALTLASETDAFMPIPVNRPFFWSVSGVKPLSLAFSLGIALLAASCVPLLRNKRALGIYLASSALLLALFFLKGHQQMRHEGFLYLAWLFALWISWEKRIRLRSFSGAFIVFVLVVSALGGERAVRLAMRYSFSNSQEMAAHVVSIPPGDQVLAYPSWATSALAPYLPSGFRFYCLETEGPCSYVVWTHAFDSWSNDASAIGAKVLAFQAAHPGQTHYLLFRDPNMLESAGLSAQYRPYATVSHACLSGACSYYMYIYDPRAASSSASSVVGSRSLKSS